MKVKMVTVLSRARKETDLLDRFQCPAVPVTFLCQFVPGTSDNNPLPTVTFSHQSTAGLAMLEPPRIFLRGKSGYVWVSTGNGFNPLP